MTIDFTSTLQGIARRLTPICEPPQGDIKTGSIQHVGATLLTAYLPEVFMGEICQLLPDKMLAEVVGIEGDVVQLSPFGATTGLQSGQPVSPLRQRHRIRVGEALLGRVVDGLGHALDDGPALQGNWRDFDAVPPCALKRQLIDTPLITGVRAIDSLLTCGEGQRVGIFAAAGVGKSQLLSMLCHSSDADINLLVLIGERGREVREFLQQALGEETLKRSVVVVSTSDRPALERMRALFVATTIAEDFRDRGYRVLLLVDSLTRYARAAREIGLAAGEIAVSGGYPPGVFAALPRLLERAGKGERGSITAFYTVLVEGDDMNEPLADEVRSLLDGHIVLSRRLAESGHFPAIDVLASLSRIMPAVTSERHREYARQVRHWLAVYREVELLVRVGEFQRGEDPDADRAVDAYPNICAFLQQHRSEICDIDILMEKLHRLTRSGCSVRC